jgi:adenylosuccinate synthase
VPSGILNRRATNVVGNGVVLHAPGLFDEVARLEARGVPVLPRSAGGIHPDAEPPRLLVSDRAQLLFDLHKEVDGAREAELAGGQIGTTRRGIGPAYASKATRNGLRVADLLGDPAQFRAKLKALAQDAARRFPAPSAVAAYDADADADLYLREYAPRLRALVADTVDYVNDAHDAGKRLLVEGANATMLDVDFGTYPFVTSSSPCVGGVASGLGLAPTKFGAVVGVAKAYTTRVGAGPYPTEIAGDLAEKVRAIGGEYGTTTGRPRRVGWLDVVALRFAHKINGLTHLCLTKLDVLSGLGDLPVAVGYRLTEGPGKGRVLDSSVPADLAALASAEVVYETLPGWGEDISACRAWGDLPAAARAYVERVEALVGVPVAWVGVGPGRDAMVCRGDAAGGRGGRAAPAAAAAAATARR